MNSKSGLSTIFIPDVLETLRSPKLTFESELRWLFDFDPGLSGMFEDEINYQKRNQSWNEFEIRFVQGFLTWCTPNPLLTIAGRNILARLASVFCTYRNKHILEWFWRSNFVLENAISFSRVIVEWFSRGCIVKWSYFYHEIMNWRGCSDETSELYLMGKHSMLLARFGHCQVVQTMLSEGHSTWNWNFDKTENRKTAASIIFLSEMHNVQSAKKLPDSPRISNNVEIMR